MANANPKPDEDAKKRTECVRIETGSLTSVVPMTPVKKAGREHCTLPEALVDLPHLESNSWYSESAT